MNKPYFAKYLTVEGEIKKGDYFVLNNTGPIICLLHDFPQECEGVKKVKLFLCSRDIQVGDKIWAYTEIGDQPGFPNTPEEGVCTEVNGDYITYTGGWQPQIYLEKKWCWKVIGEISSEALSYVKEGYEFDEEQVRKAVYVELYYADAEEQWQNNIQYVSVEQTYQPKIISKTYYETVLHEVIEVKGSCNHFH